MPRIARGGRRELSALTFSPALADDTEEGALYLHWQFDSAVPAGLESHLQPLRENARQAGVEISFDAIGNDWQVKLTGLQEPMPAVLEALVSSLNQSPELPDASTPMIAIRELLKALPACCAGGVADESEKPASWASAHWQGFGVGFPPAGEAAIKAAAARLPGQPASLVPRRPSLNGQRLWHEVNTHSSEPAVLLFCPTPTASLADEAAWRLLGHRLQGPFYQRLRVELQLGYAVFSGVRQINGQTGLLFGVQSPSISVEGIVDHLLAFLKQLPRLVDDSEDVGNSLVAQQFSPHTLPITQAADLLWQAHLAGHPSDYLAQLQQAIQSCTQASLQHAAQQLNDATGGWRCVANGPRINDSWHTPS